MTAKEYADMVISLDADLQDDVKAIEKMVDEYHNGYEIVYGVRSSREKDTFFKKTTAKGFYKFMKLLGVEIVFNHADYRLMSKASLDVLAQFEEVNLFLRGIIPLIGFKSTTVEYERDKRFAGESKYPLSKMLAFAFDGITSFSIKTNPNDYLFGIFNIFSKFNCAYRFHYSKIYRFHNRGLDLYCGIYLDDRRHTVALFRCHRRIYRKNI